MFVGMQTFFASRYVQYEIGVFRYLSYMIAKFICLD